MGKERALEVKKKIRVSRFIRIGEIIPGVMRDIEKRIKEPHKNKKARVESKAEEAS